MTQAPTILAIDFGTVRIGVAISRGTLAEPLIVLANSDQVFEQIAAICQQEQVTHLVVGLSENTMALLTQNFAKKLQEYVKLPLEFMDETLSSHTVGGKLKARGLSLQKRQQAIDAFAAAEFLQEYLDAQASNSVQNHLPDQG